MNVIIVLVALTSVSTVLCQSTFPPTFMTSTSRPYYCTLNCIWYPNTYENYNTCSCECLPGYSKSVGGCVSVNTILTSIMPTSFYGKQGMVETEITKPPVPITTTAKQCNLDCRLGFLISNSYQCECLCVEFYYFDGKTCTLKSMFPRVNDCNECQDMPNIYDRPMRCVSNQYDKFCVP